MDRAREAVFGLGNNIDYEVAWDGEILCALMRQFALRAADLEEGANRSIACERDLLISALSLMRRGVGGEFFVHCPEAITQYAARFPCAHTLGGTGVRAAIAADKLGVAALAHLVNMNGEVRSLLPASIAAIAGAREGKAYPHLIVQYPGGKRLFCNDIDFVIPRSNRLIYVNDPDNAAMALSGALPDALARAKIFLVSGFNAMRDGALLRERLDTLTKAMARMPGDGVVFFEDGCYHEAAFRQIVNQSLAPHVHIFSLNEDELMGYAGRALDLSGAGEVLAAVDDLQRALRVPCVVVHTRYWALARAPGARRLARPLLGGIAMATARLALGDRCARADYEDALRMPREAEGLAFAREIAAAGRDDLWCEPSLRAAVPNPTTVGLGDAFVGGFLAELLSLFTRI